MFLHSLHAMSQGPFFLPTCFQDFFGSVDGFVACSFEGQEMKTKVEKNSFTPLWDETFTVQVHAHAKRHLPIRTKQSSAIESHQSS